MSPAEKSLEVVNDLLIIVQSASIQGKDAARIGNCLAYLGALKGELEKEVKNEKPHVAEVAVDQASA